MRRAKCKGLPTRFAQQKLFSNLCRQALILYTRSQEFYNVWGEFTKLVLSNIKTTIEQVNKKLNS